MVIKSITKTVLCAVLFIILSNPFTQANELQLDDSHFSRFIFKLYAFKNEPEIRSSLLNGIERYLNCSTNLKNISMWLDTSDHPRELMKFISEYNSEKNLKLFTCSSLEQMDLAPSIKLYVIFASEYGESVESSMGHVLLLLRDEDNLMLSKVISFAATDFVDSSTGQASVSSYWRGAVKNLEGRYSESFFFDEYFETVIKEKRRLLLYSINPEIVNTFSLNEILSSKLGGISSYNFFTDNCSVKILDIVNQASSIKTQINGFTTPAKHLDLLESTEAIEYIGAYLPPQSIAKKTSDNHSQFYTEVDYTEFTNSTPSSLSIVASDNFLFAQAFLYNSSPIAAGYTLYGSDSRILGANIISNESNIDFGFSLLKISRYNAINLDGMKPAWGLLIDLLPKPTIKLDVGFGFTSNFIRSGFYTSLSTEKEIMPYFETVAKVHDLSFKATYEIQTELLELNANYAVNSRLSLELLINKETIGGGVTLSL